MPEEQKPEGVQGASPAPTDAKQPGSAAPAAGAPATPPAAAAPKPAAPPRPAPPKPPAAPPPPPVWNGDLPTALQAKFGDRVSEFLAYRDQPSFIAEAGSAHELLETLRDVHGFDYLVDVTAVHWPQREQVFDVIYVLYSFSRNERIRMKIRIKEGEQPRSAVDVYVTANWLEREVFDMFGVVFEGHPDLRRILMPEEWTGHPLRKDYGIQNMDNRWVQENLGIESGQ